MANPSEIEIIVRLSSDDADTIKVLPAVRQRACRVIVGEPVIGYHNHPRAIDEALAATKAPWVVGFTDDSVVRGGGWVDFLKTQPSDGVIVLPEWHRLGNCTYHHDYTTPVMFIPRDCWKRLGQESVGLPPDACLFQLLRGHGWRTVFIPGFTWHHFFDPHLPD